MQCFFQSGNQNANTPATIIIYGFNQAFTQVRFAFTFKAPTLNNPIVAPLTIYVLQGAQSYFKSYYQYVDQAIVILTSQPQTSTENTAPSYSPATYKSSSTLSISLGPSQTLQPSDYYIIKVPQMSQNANSQTESITLPNQVTAQATILADNGYIIINPSSSLAGGSSYNAQIPQVYTPDMPLSASNMTTTGFVAYFSRMSAEKVSYTAPPSFQVLTAFPINPRLSISNQFINQNSVITFIITAGWRGIRSLIIQFPPQLQVGATCFESITSNIMIQSCITDPSSNNRVLITLEDQAFPASNSVLGVLVLAVNGPNQVNVNAFTYSAYSTIETDPSQTSGLVYQTSTVPPTTLQAPNNGQAGPLPSLIDFEYVPFIEFSNGAQGLTGAYDDIALRFQLARTLVANDQMVVSFSGFSINFNTQNLGDVSSYPAMILSSGNYYILVRAQYSQSSNTMSFTLPPAAASAGVFLNTTVMDFRVTQVAVTGDTIGISTNMQGDLNYYASLEVFGSNGQAKNIYNNIFVNHTTKQVSTTTAPIRIKFQLDQTLLPGLGRVLVSLPANSFNFVLNPGDSCEFRSYFGLGQDYVYNPGFCSIGGSLAQGYVIQANTTTGRLSAGVIHELVINSAFNVFVGASNQATVSFANNYNFFAYANVDVYQYQATPFAALNDFYFTSIASQTPNTLILSVTSNRKINNFPLSTIEIELTSASSSKITSGVSQSNPQMQCGVVGLSVRQNSVSDIRCIVVNSSPPKVRIENYDTISANQNFNIMLYALDNSVIAQDLYSYFDASIIVNDMRSSLLSRHNLVRMFTPLTGTAQSSAPESDTFSINAEGGYGTTSHLSTELSWTSSNACVSCKIIGQANNLPWQLQNGGVALLINGAQQQNILVDNVNNIFGRL